MIIDIHTHAFPDSIARMAIQKLEHASHTIPFTDGTYSGLLRSEQEAGVDLAVVQPVATSPRQVIKINDYAAQINETYDGKGIVSFASIHPDFDGWKKELSRISSLGFKGIKVHPVYHCTDLDDIRYLRIFDRAAELGLIVLTHSGTDVGSPELVHCTPQMVRHVCDAIGDFTLIAAHMGCWKDWSEVPDLLADTSVYLDTSFSTGYLHPLEKDYYSPDELKLLDEQGFLRLLSAFGPDRILFGTDSPWSNIRESLDFIRALPVSEEDKKKICGLNAQKLLEL